jgi:hypothetical protein
MFSFRIALNWKEASKYYFPFLASQIFFSPSRPPECTALRVLNSLLSFPPTMTIEKWIFWKNRARERWLKNVTSKRSLGIEKSQKTKKLIKNLCMRLIAYSRDSLKCKSKKVLTKSQIHSSSSQKLNYINFSHTQSDNLAST